MTKPTPLNHCLAAATLLLYLKCIWVPWDVSLWMCVCVCTTMQLLRQQRESSRAKKAPLLFFLSDIVMFRGMVEWWLLWSQQGKREEGIHWKLLNACFCYCVCVQDSIQLVGLPCSIAAPLSKVKQVRLTTRGRQQQPVIMMPKVKMPSFWWSKFF